MPSDKTNIAHAVAAFHATFGLPRSDEPTADIPAELAALRVRLLAEEVEEFATATEQRDIVGIADALADIVYVAYGSAITYGIDLDAVLAEVHRSNMTKLDDDGRVLLRQDGKVAKSQNYTPPNVAGVLRDQARSRAHESP
ncbi:MazG nucleotide pyrophosphohydrolase domain-containing protein [Actinoallomurus bryophytorum]|uniref:Putative HAD superfamily Cof-like phosphohydrolase n=1 Tax=Actinoallomurus bryophytorum TaxID=1490222 RepID=A0A543CLE9_9ACTN|nr:nucleoside triphosphate pyrophosphohydrolase family protein [Actinoallomurus bryophytorum]TQL97727.1 putative HAD superfamily Cof-like phosphohydrolase [Actinoallomurus bryophytorum]